MPTKVGSDMTTGLVSGSKASTTPSTTSSGDANKIVALNASGQVPDHYVKMDIKAHQWRYTGDFAVGTGEVVVDTGDGWEEVDTAPQDVNGTSMTVNEGVFSFPETGLWLVTLNALFARNSGDVTLVVADLFATTGSGGTTEVRVGQGCGSVHTDNLQSTVVVSSLVNVDNVSNVKVKTKVSASSSGADFKGNSTFNRSYFTFLRVSPLIAGD
tara:strand:- start:1765 stop:2403 length:639 start_codon:yes stop_codon:yes gene_type:complete